MNARLANVSMQTLFRRASPPSVRAQGGLFAVLGALVLAAGCGGAPPPPKAAPTEPDPPIRTEVQEGRETFIDDPDKTKGVDQVREYVLDVTHSVEWKGGVTPKDMKLPDDKVLRVRVRFPIPKCEPPDARDIHSINRTLWNARQEMAKCFYKGSGKEPTPELSMVAFAKILPSGDVEDAGLESFDPALKPAAECILENVKGLSFEKASAPAKIRFKLKMQTVDATGANDVAPPPPRAK